MTNLSWLAAVISPRSVAPHPNFRSVDKVTPAGLLALVIQNREHDLMTLQERMPGVLTDDEQALIQGTIGLFNSESIHESVPVLAELATHRMTEPGIATAASLLACLGFAELDRHFDALETLRQVELVDAACPDDELLLRGSLAQQAAMRAAEIGLPYEEEREAAQRHLTSVTSTELSRYPTSRGSRWPAAGTNRQILQALIQSNQDLFDSAVLFPTAKALQRRLRRPQAELISACLMTESTGLSAYTEERFSTIVQSNEKTFRSEDPVDTPVWRALTFFEIIGHARHARSHRSRLGKLRLVRSGSGGNITVQENESLRLLRHGGDLKDLRLALNHTRSHGPLTALRLEAQQVVSRRLSPALLKDVELAVLEYGAQLLDEDAAEAALWAVFEALDSSEVQGNPGEIPAVRVEHLIRSAAALASVTGNEEELAHEIFDRLVRIGPISDQLLSNAYARGLVVVDWDEVSSRSKSQWFDWASNLTLSEGWDSVVNLVLPRVRPTSTGAIDGKQITLSMIANELNAVMAGEIPPPWLKMDGERLLTDVLERSRNEAKHGQISFYGSDLADLAVCMNLFLGSDLWLPLQEFLLTIQLPHSQKAGALNRLSGDPQAVPEAFRLALSSSTDILLTQSALVSPFDTPESKPFPAAIRFLSSIGALTDEQLLEAVTTLAAGQVRDRLEASRTLPVVAKHEPVVGQWIVTTALQLSGDSDATVRAEAGRAIARVLTRTDFARTLLTDRLLQLLSEDGILVPLLVLRGVTSNDLGVTTEIEAKLRELRTGHIAKVIRSHADLLLRGIQD